MLLLSQDNVSRRRGFLVVETKFHIVFLTGSARARPVIESLVDNKSISGVVVAQSQNCWDTQTVS